MTQSLLDLLGAEDEREFEKVCTVLRSHLSPIVLSTKTSCCRDGRQWWLHALMLAAEAHAHPRQPSAASILVRQQLRRSSRHGGSASHK